MKLINDSVTTKCIMCEEPLDSAAVKTLTDTAFEKLLADEKVRNIINQKLP